MAASRACVARPLPYPCVLVVLSQVVHCHDWQSARVTFADCSGVNCTIARPLLLQRLRMMPSQVVHCHDWQSAPVAFADRGGSGCVFTIHNLDYGRDLIARAMGGCQVRQR